MSEKSWTEIVKELESDLEYTRKWVAENKDIPDVISVMLLEGRIATRANIRQYEQWAKEELEEA